MLMVECPMCGDTDIPGFPEDNGKWAPEQTNKRIACADHKACGHTVTAQLADMDGEEPVLQVTGPDLDAPMILRPGEYEWRVAELAY